MDTPYGPRLFSAGDILLLSSAVKCVFRQNPHDLLTVLHIHFDFCSQDGSAFDLFPNTKDFFINNVADFDFFVKILRKVIYYYDCAKTDIAAQWLRSAISELVESKRMNVQADHIDFSKIIGDICGRISEKPDIKYPLSEMASRCGYSPDYFGRRFKEITGLSFSKYVLNARINRAKDMLINSDDTIADIANKLGYCDPSFFTKQFKRMTHMTPSDFRGF